MSYDESIGQQTNQINKKMMRYLNSKLESYDITLEQWNVLLKLSQQNKINQKQLAENVDKDQPTLARILSILQRKKLIARQTDEKDKRASNVQITDKGLSLKKEIEPFIESCFEIITEGISKEEIEAYKLILIKMNQNIDRQEKGRNK